MFTNHPIWDPELLQRTLAKQATDLASLIAALGGAAPLSPANPDVMRQPLIERYRQLFMPSGLAGADGQPATAGAALLRYQHAFRCFARELNGVAIDAAERLTEALSQEEHEAPDITTLRELHTLWVDCGEAAYAAAAHRDEFAEAQAELLAAFVEMRAGLASP